VARAVQFTGVMTEIRTTVVVAPREQFGWTRPALESIFAHTEVPYNLVYVDGGSPAPVRRYLTLRARQRGFRLLRTEHHLSPMEARALALPHVDTEYVCFIDNDVLVTPGWLARLVRCADETEAWAVGPLYCNENPALGRIHMAGGQAHVVEEDGRRSFFEEHRFPRRFITEVRSHLRREPTELVEFHCKLLRTELFDKFGSRRHFCGRTCPSTCSAGATRGIGSASGAFASTGTFPPTIGGSAITTAGSPGIGGWLGNGSPGRHARRSAGGAEAKWRASSSRRYTGG
jgi:Glycosyl transferase family 2